MRRLNFFDGAESSVVPTIGNISASDLVKYANDAAYEADNLGSPINGNIYYNTTNNLIRFYNGTSWIDIVDEESTQTLQNKTIDGTSATGNNTVTTDADQITYDNATSGLTATDVQAALDEVEGRVDANETDIADVRTTTGTSDSDTDMGSYVAATNGFNLTAAQSTKNNIQELVDEVDAKINLSEKGAANGVAELDAGGKIPSGQLPSYVDDVLEYADLASFPVTGETGKIYVAIDTSKAYRWTGSIYVEISPSEVNSVNSQTGAVVLDADDIDDAATTNKFATQAQLDKVDFLTVTQAVDLDTVESDTATNNAKVSADGSIDTHSDVDTTTVPPANGQALVWNSGDSEWQPGDVAASGGGQGGINYILNPDFETDISGWVAYADGGASPTDGTGGSPSIVVNANTTTQLRGSTSLRIGVGVPTIGDGVSYDFSIDPQDADGKNLFLSFDYVPSTTSYDSGNLAVFIYDITNATLIGRVQNDDNGDILYSSSKTRFQGIFQTTDSLSYRLIIHCVTSVTGNEISIDNVKVGPDSVVPGAIITPWQSFTPTISNFGAGSTTSSYGFYRRVGTNIEMVFGFIKDGTPGSGTGALTVDFPNGLVGDTTKFQDGAIGSFSNLGAYRMRRGGSGNNETEVVYAGTDGLFFRETGTGTNLTGADFTANTSFAAQASVSIEGWEASATMSTTEVGLQTVFATGTIADPAPGGTITYNLTATDDKFGIVQSNQIVIPRTGNYTIYADVNTDVTTWSAANNAIGLQIHVDSGSGFSSPGDFGRDEARAAGSFQIFTGGSYSARFTKGTLIEIRHAASITTGGDGKFIVVGHPDFTHFSVYGKNEYLEATSSTKTLVASGDYALMVGNSVTLTPGTWMVNGVVDYGRSGTANYTREISTWAASNGSDTGSGPTGLGAEVVAGKQNADNFPNTNHAEFDQVMPTIRVVVTENLEVFLVPYATAVTPANTRITTYIYAERIS